MDIKTQPRLRFISVDFPVVSFNSENNLNSEDIDVQIEPKLFIPQNQNKHFKIIQEVKVSVENVFNLFIVAIGNFEIMGEENDVTRSTFINKNAPAIMFPYIRSFIATLTANTGNVTGTLNIPPQFFSGSLKQIDEEGNEIQKDETT